MVRALCHVSARSFARGDAGTRGSPNLRHQCMALRPTGAFRGAGPLPHPFSPVSVTPSMKYRWQKKKTSRTGSMTIVDAAIR